MKRTCALSIACLPLLFATVTTAAGDEGRLEKEEALLLWVISDWASSSCPAPAVPPLTAMFAGAVERAAPADVLDRARSDYLADFLDKFAHKDAACLEIRRLDDAG